MTEKLVPIVQADAIGAEQPAHPRHQIGIGCFNDQMKMIVHQTVGMHLPARFLAGLSQGL